MGKLALKSLVMFVAAAAFALTAAEKKEPMFSSTIDYLDYVFFDKLAAGKEYYPLEIYEQRIREMAEGGVKKIYLRVNVCGTTHYPSEVSALYGEDGAFHWTFKDGALRLIETYKHYDPVAETIRLGKKYGMEVWAWESLFDDAGVRYNESDCPPEFIELYRRHDGWALLDPFYRDNMDALAERDPRLIMPEDKVEELTREARKNPIGKIVFTNLDKGGAVPDFTGEDIDVLTSSDNINYRSVGQPFKFTTSVTPEGFNRFEISGLNITDPYVKIVGKKPFSTNRFSFILKDARGQGEIFDINGRKVASVWTWHDAPAGRGALNFANLTGSAAWDYGNRQIGFIVGELKPQRYYLGVAEFNVPKAMKHKVDRFEELARYPFDGFMFNVRCHSRTANPEQYGFNPEVREKFLKRFGKDIYKDDFDLADLFQLRAEAIADFFVKCKELSDGRPIYLSGVKNPGTGQRAYYGEAFGPLPWLYKRYFADGSIDGVIMIGDDFADYFTDEITGGKPIKLGVFREMAHYPADRAKGAADLRELKKRSDLDEVELYETLILTDNPEIYDIIKE